MYTRNTASDFEDFDLDQLVTWRKQAVVARQALLTSGKPASLGESNGVGSRSVTYTAADIPKLDILIRNLSDEIGYRRTGRRGTRGAFDIT